MSNIEEFRNNVFCRREINQHKADKLWREIKVLIPPVERQEFQGEWEHYLIGEITTDQFARHFVKYVLNPLKKRFGTTNVKRIPKHV